jgi:hypothetical protein
MITSLLQVEGLESDPKLKMYLYIDENFAYKTRTYHGSSNLPINLEIDM